MKIPAIKGKIGETIYYMPMIYMNHVTLLT